MVLIVNVTWVGTDPLLAEQGGRELVKYDVGSRGRSHVWQACGCGVGMVEDGRGEKALCVGVSVHVGGWKDLEGRKDVGGTPVSTSSTLLDRPRARHLPATRHGVAASACPPCCCRGEQPCR